MTKKVIEFLRKKDFELVNELGQGACGKTVLLYDGIIRENFVCKKYSPLHEAHRELLFDNFVQEIKLLHLISHKNIVRVFNYYLYPEQKTGYILMEYIQGTDIESYIEKHPENINEIFLQAIDGFSYLEEQNILHRDIRPMNLMVANDGLLKIIDFGFGKKIFEKSDFDKSISLNWWCEPPREFSEGRYEFSTEVYFIGKLFEKIIVEKELEHFKYLIALNGMCKIDPDKRVKSFFEVKKGIENEKFSEIEFGENELNSYRLFSGELYRIVSKIEQGTKYFEDSDRVQTKLDELYKKVMLEEFVPSNSSIVKCFVNGSYYFNKQSCVSVGTLKSFLDLLKSCSKEKKNIILSNLLTKLDAVERYEIINNNWDEDIPF